MIKKLKDCKHPELTVESYIEGYSAWRLPEFRAFMKAIGFDVEDDKRPTTGMTIHIPVDGLVKITHEFFAQEPKE